MDDERLTEQNQNADGSVTQVIKAKGGGVIRNVTQIGKVVVQLVDEQVFRRLGLEQRVGFIMIGILIVGTTTALYLTLRPQQPNHMAGDFRIAVVGFDQVGDSRDTEIGEELAEGVRLRLQQAFKEMGLNFTVSVWGPKQVGVIRGHDRDERARAAEEMAKKIGADVVVYGLINATTPVWSVTPEFYVSLENFYQAQEIVGQHEMGAPFVLKGQGNIAERIEFSAELTTRVQVLSWVSVGLAYFANQDFEHALSAFQSVEKVPGWEDSEGRQVVYLLSGSAAAKRENLELAEEYHRQALTVDPNYARAHLGLAGTYYLRSWEMFKETLVPSDIDAASLHRAIDLYQQASHATVQPALSDISTKIRFGLGQCYMMLTFSGEDQSFDRAMLEFEAVIAEYGKGTNPRLRELAAESHARLGLIYSLTGYNSQAVQEYQQAASLLHDYPERRSLFEERAQKLTRDIEDMY